MISLEHMYHCPSCYAPLIKELTALSCEACKTNYPVSGEIPILLTPLLRSEGNPTDQVKQDIQQHYTQVSESLEKGQVSKYVTFLNYGYLPSANEQYSPLEIPQNTMSRNAVKLLFEVIGQADLEGKHILDVGCGRGGSIEILNRFFKPAMLVGLDITEASIRFNHNRNKFKHIHFCVGDAESLPFGNESFDVVLNIESSYAYPDMTEFYRQVDRVLKKGSHFLYGDILPVSKFEESARMLNQLGFETIRNQDISENILLSCDQSASRNAEAYGALDDAFMARLRESLCLPGSQIYSDLISGVKQFRIMNLLKA
ncbi:methyltransferase domain-containing protein [Paenibacillus ferrarius]|uniref:methyltransferase domain-containing protein n=1 Tax=Paenibacillus ferrarius TaxID=1469647 RepID=UPI001FC937A2|nr:methyltransferase domain-containing protein [Paenibacillus ferrarius]